MDMPRHSNGESKGTENRLRASRTHAVPFARCSAWVRPEVRDGQQAAERLSIASLQAWSLLAWDLVRALRVEGGDCVVDDRGDLVGRLDRQEEHAAWNRHDLDRRTGFEGVPLVGGQPPVALLGVDDPGRHA